MLFLALRQLLTRKKQSLFILVGVILGTTAYVVISGVMLGFQQFLLDQLVNNTAQITISAREQYVTRQLVEDNLFKPSTLVHWMTPLSGVRELDYILNPQGWYQKLRNNSKVVAFVPQLTASILLSHGAASRSITVTGTLAQQQIKVTTIGNYMTSGHFTDLKQGSKGIILGARVAQQLGVTRHNTVNVATQNGRVLPFQVVGIFKTGNRHIDNGSAYASLNDVQSLQNQPGHISNIAVKITKPYEATQLANQWQAFSKDTVESWQQFSQNILSVFTVQNFIRYFMVCSILLVSAFGIYNVLNIMINQKRREIAILRAIGYSAADIVRLFFIQGVLFGAIGGIIGLIFGGGICLYISTLPAVGMAATGDNTMIVAFNPSIYLYGLLLALGSATIASIIPSRTAGKLKPVAIIRSEAST